MAFQKQDNNSLAKGIAGQLASLNPAVFDTNNYPAGEDGVTAGLAVWADSTTETYTNAGTGKPTGIALSVFNYANLDLSKAANMLIPEGQTVTVLKKGDVFVDCTTIANIGQKIYVNVKDGTFKADAAGTDTKDTDWLETDFYVVEGSGAAGDLILISNWS